MSHGIIAKEREREQERERERERERAREREREVQRLAASQKRPMYVTMCEKETYICDNV